MLSNLINTPKILKDAIESVTDIMKVSEEDMNVVAVGNAEDDVVVVMIVIRIIAKIEEEVIQKMIEVETEGKEVIVEVGKEVIQEMIEVGKEQKEVIAEVEKEVIQKILEVKKELKEVVVVAVVMIINMKINTLEDIVEVRNQVNRKTISNIMMLSIMMKMKNITNINFVNITKENIKENIHEYLKRKNAFNYKMKKDSNEKRNKNQ